MEHCSVSAFHYFHWSHKTTSFLLKFSHNTASQFRYVIYFYDRDWQSSFHFSEFAGVHIGLLLGRQLKYCMKIFYKSTNERYTKPSHRWCYQVNLDKLPKYRNVQTIPITFCTVLLQSASRCLQCNNMSVHKQRKLAQSYIH